MHYNLYELNTTCPFSNYSAFQIRIYSKLFCPKRFHQAQAQVIKAHGYLETRYACRMHHYEALIHATCERIETLRTTREMNLPAITRASS